MKLALRILLWLTYPFLALSILLLLGMPFGMVFVTSFEIVNGTGQTIRVTPVGTVGKEGSKHPLPIMMRRLPVLPAIKAGGFRLASGESVTICYDWDDINFSEIVVEDGQGQQYQLVVDPTPTTNQYHAPGQRRFIIDDLKSLGQADPRVSAAARRAKRYQSGALIMNALLIAPWLAYGALRFAISRYRPRTDIPTGVERQ